MAAEEVASKASNGPTTHAGAQETTPLLHKVNSRGERKWPKSVAYLVLLTGFLVSLSFGVTQVPYIYSRHPLPFSYQADLNLVWSTSSAL